MKRSRMFITTVLILGLSLLTSCRESSSEQSGALESDYSLTISPEIPSILENFDVTLSGPPVRSLSLQVQGPSGDATHACQARENENAGSKTYTCYVEISGEYAFNLSIQPFSGPEVALTSRARIGNAHRFTLELSQGSKVIRLNQTGSVDGNLTFFNNSPVHFRFLDGGDFATVVLADGSRQSDDFSHSFSEAGPQPFRVEMARVRRDFSLVIECPVNTYPPVRIDRVDVTLLSNGAYQYTPVVGMGQMIAFKMDVNGDAALDTPWIRTSSTREFSLLTGADRPLTVFGMDACGGINASTVSTEIPAVAPKEGRGYLWANLIGLSNEEFSANVEHFYGASLPSVSSQDRGYSFSVDRRPQGAGNAIRIDVEQNEYVANLDDDRHGAHLAVVIPNSLVPAHTGDAQGIVQVAARELMYQTASEGDVTLGKKYENLAPFDLQILVSKVLEREGPCSSAGRPNDYQIRIEGRFLSPIELTQRDGGANPKRLEIKGKFVLYETRRETKDCIPAPICIIQSLGSFLGTAASPQSYDQNVYQGVLAGARIQTSGNVSSMSFNGSSVTSATQYFTPASIGAMPLSASVTGAGGTANCATDIQVLRKPSSGCVVELSSQSIVVQPGSAVAARLRDTHLALNGGTASNIRLNGNAVALNEWVTIPVSAVGPFTISGGYTSSDGAPTCSGGGFGIAAPAPRCEIQGPGTVYLSDTFGVSVQHAQYYGNSWSGTLQGHAISSSTTTQKFLQFSPGNYQLSASVLLGDGTTISCGKPIEVRPAPLGCVILVNQAIYQGMPGMIGISSQWADKHGGLAEASIDGQSVISTGYRMMTFPNTGNANVMGYLRANDGSEASCPGVISVQSLPPLGCDLSPDSSQSVVNSGMTFRIYPRNLQFHGGSVTSAQMGSAAPQTDFAMAAVDLATLRRTVTPTRTGTFNMTATIQAGGKSASCGGASIVVPDIPPPPTNLCNVTVKNMSGQTLSGTVTIPGTSMQIQVFIQAQGMGTATLSAPGKSQTWNLPAQGGSGSWSFTQTVTQATHSNAVFRGSVDSNGDGTAEVECPNSVSFLEPF